MTSQFFLQLKEKMKNRRRMTIPAIKSTLSIQTVLAHYGLKAGAKGAMKCPFHTDGKASMKIYPETNTAFCFAGSCDVQSVDVIDFIMRMDGSTKRAAIMKAKELIGQPVSIPAKVEPTPPALDIQKIYTESLATFDRTPSGRAYCEQRGLRPEVLGIGYKSRKSKERWGRGCIIFPLVDKNDEVVSLYGRAVKGNGHYYTAGRKGLYPSYPAKETKQLILTESVIDAATLIGREVMPLALYGTNGLTAEHRTAIQNLPELEEIILALDGDAAGRKATVAIAAELRALRPTMKITTLVLPEGEDINGLFVGHEDGEGLLSDLLGKRVAVAEVVTALEKVEPGGPPFGGGGGLIQHAHYLEYLGTAATYRVRGGIRGGAESLKVSLQIRTLGQDYRAKIDLYEHKQTVTLAERTAEVLIVRKDQVLDDLTQLTELLEAYRENPANKKESSHPRPRPEMMPGERAALLSFLKRPDLLDQLGEYLGRAGIVGEEKSRLLIYLVALSHGTDAPLHALVQGSSGSGKTHLITKISELLPPEDVITLTRVTDSSFYNYGREDLKQKLIVLEDLDGLKEEALLAFRELQSRGRLTSSTSIKDESGNIRGVVRTVEGPVASLAATTRGEIYEDNLSRCLIVAVDETDLQTRAVIDYQNRRAAGLIDVEEEVQLRTFLRSCARLLDHSKTVVNPYATAVELPAEASKLRRLNALYQSFVRQIVLLHQYQRQTDEKGRIVAEVSDLRAACDILFDSILLKVDELDGALRYFYERLKTYVLERGREYEFTRREVRQALRISKTQQHAYMTQLLDLEYLKQSGGYANRGLTYKVVYWDDSAALRTKIKADLSDQLAKATPRPERHGTPARTPEPA
ncbi:MAG: DNA primase [Neolewinella sp.]